MKLKKLTTTSIALLGMIQAAIPAQAAETVARPVQYVMLAFDGSYNNSVWQHSRDFSLEKRAQGVDARFTFFINPVYLLWRTCKNEGTACAAPPYNRDNPNKPNPVYVPPGGNRGSAIGYGDTPQDVSERITNMNGAFEEGHELGSHAVGHWDGTSWTYQDWKKEFTQFYKILDNVFSLNQIPKPAEGLKFRNSIVGFRAPVLGYGPGLYQALPEFGIKYDTSKQSVPNYWPQQQNGGMWNFPLADIPRPGTGRVIPTMDYNFCYSDTAALKAQDPGLIGYQMPGYKANSTDPATECLNSVRPEQKEALKRNMMGMYMNYFFGNYYGNRAPIHIGHHFSPWMSGAYQETFFEFADRVCGLPEVKCVTYAELMKAMQSMSAAQKAAYQAGNFPKLPRPKSSLAAKALDVQADLVQEGNKLVIKTSGKDAKQTGMKTSIFIGAKQIEGSSVTLDEVRALTGKVSAVSIRGSVFNRNGLEVQSSTRNLRNVGTENEVLDAQSIEERVKLGHLPGAHSEDQPDLGTPGF